MRLDRLAIGTLRGCGSEDWKRKKDRNQRRPGSRRRIATKECLAVEVGDEYSL